MIWDDDELDWKEEEPKALLAPPMQPYLFLVEPLDFSYGIKENDPVSFDLEAPVPEETNTIRIDWGETVRDLFKPNTGKRYLPRSDTRGSLWDTSGFSGDAA